MSSRSRGRTSRQAVYDDTTLTPPVPPTKLTAVPSFSRTTEAPALSEAETDAALPEPANTKSEPLRRLPNRRRWLTMRRYALRADRWERIKDLLPGRSGHIAV